MRKMTQVGNFSASWNMDIVGFLKGLSLIDQERVLAPAVKKGAKVLQDNYKERVPRDTGRLQDTIRAERNKEVIDGYGFRVGTEAFYVKFLEFGTKRLKARRDMQQAYYESIGEAMQEVEYQIAVGISKIWKELERRHSS